MAWEGWNEHMDKRAKHPLIFGSAYSDCDGEPVATKCCSGGPSLPYCSIILLTALPDILKNALPQICRLIASQSSLEDLALQSIRFYQGRVSPDLSKKLGIVRKCGFNPSCSEYMYTAIERYGLLRGLNLGASRLRRCSPNARIRGYDPVP